MQAAPNTNTLTGSNKSSGMSIGASVGLGTGGVGPSLNLGMNKGRGSENGQDITYTNTTVKAGQGAGDSLTLQSGADTTLKGAEASANQVIVNVGTNGSGNLNLESLQDSSTYQNKQQGGGFNISVSPSGVPVGGSISGNNSKTNSTYQSVTQQSGIKAGDGGFQINVNGNTDLKGAVIASTDKAIQDNKNSLTTQTLTTSDIDNHANYEAKGTSISAGIGLNKQPNGNGYGTNPTSSLGHSDLNDSVNSTSVSAISGGSISISDTTKQQATTGKDAPTTIATLNRDVHVDDKGNAVDSKGNSTAHTIAPIFDKEKVQTELNAQILITDTFSKLQQQFQIDLKKKVDDAKAEQSNIAELLKNPNLTDEQRTALIAQGLNAQTNIDQLEKTSILISAVTGGLSAPTNNIGGIIAATVAPEAANQIGQYYKDHGAEGSASHILAHGVLASAVAELGGNNPLGAALSAMSGEAVAPLVADLLYGKPSTELNAEQKATVSTIASLGGMAVGASVGNSGNSLAQANQSAQNAVDNNWGMVGHYSTMATVLYLAGFSPKDAKAVALAAWGPDTDKRNAMSTNSLSSNNSNQEYIHLLDGESDPQKVIAMQQKLAEQVQNILLTIKQYENNPSLKLDYLTKPEIQNTLHAFGDSFAHVKSDGTHYSSGQGHVNDSVFGNDPDNPSTHPDAYKNYVNTLFSVASQVAVITRVSKDTIVNLENNVISTSEKNQVNVLNNSIGSVNSETSSGLVNSPVSDCGALNGCANKPIGSQVNPQIKSIYNVKK